MVTVNLEALFKHFILFLLKLCEAYSSLLVYSDFLYLGLEVGGPGRVHHSLWGQANCGRWQGEVYVWRGHLWLKSNPYWI